MYPEQLKERIKICRQAAADRSRGDARKELAELIADDATVHMCHPFGTLTGPEGFYDTCLHPLASALPDLERRDMILLAGTTPEGQEWVGAMGNYMGTFLTPFLDILRLVTWSICGITSSSDSKTIES